MTRMTLVLVFWAVTIMPAWAAAPPHVIVVAGVDGTGLCGGGMMRGIQQACPEATIEEFNWTSGQWYNVVYHCFAIERNRALAGLLAEQIQSCKAKDPITPIILVGHSAGGAIIVMALEQLPPECNIEQAILLGPGMSCGYPIAPALEHLTHGMDVFYSPLDCVILGVGTLCLGTLDRKLSVSAGMIGFQQPKCMDEASESLYCTKLRQHCYEAAMCRFGHLGGHFTWTLSKFVTQFVGPVLQP